MVNIHEQKFGGKYWGRVTRNLRFGGFGEYERKKKYSEVLSQRFP